MTPEQERRANEYANQILAELCAASTPAQCAAIAKKYEKAFARLEAAYPLRALHIMNAAAAKKREFANAPKTLPAKSPRRSMGTHKEKPKDLFD